MFTANVVAYLDSVVTGYVARINARIVGRLDATRARFALLQNTIAIRTGDQITAPICRQIITVSKTSFGFTKIFKRYLKIEIISYTLLRTDKKTRKKRVKKKLPTVRV